MCRLIKYSNILFIVMIILSVMGLMFIFPLLGDDLLHGNVGNGLFFMEGINGRYLGNLFGINLSSNLLLRVIVKSFVVLSITYLIYKVSQSKEKSLLYLTFLLLFIMPKEYFRQIIVNTSGFGNYVIPMVGILLIINFHLNCPKENKLFYGILLFIVGISNSLFVEHVTIYNILLSVYLLIYSLVKKKDKISYFSYFFGSLVGTVLMFSNPIYTTSFVGADNYRSLTPFGKMLDKFFIIVSDSFYSNFLLVLFFIFLAFVLIKFINKESKLNTVFSKISTLLITIFSVYYLLDYTNSSWVLFGSEEVEFYFEGILTLLFYLNFIYLVCASTFIKEDKYRLSLFLISFLIIMGPLLVVNPIGPRCYFNGYIFLILFIIQLLKILNDLKFITLQKCTLIVCTAILLIILYYYNIYGMIYVESNKRIELINNEIKKGSQYVEFNNLPYMDYLHGAETCPEYNEKVFRIYYNIDDDIVFVKEGC